MIDPADVADLQLEDVEDYNSDYPPVGFPQADENIHTSGGEQNKGKYRRAAVRDLLTRNKWATGFIAMLVLICIVMISVLVGDAKSSNNSASDNSTSDSNSKNQPPIAIDPESLDPTITAPLLQSLLGAYGRHSLDAFPLDEEAGLTPQRQAFYWLATDDELADFDHTETIQRYALAVFYYATNAKSTTYTHKPEPWVDAFLWMSNAHVCEWRGIECNKQNHVQSINLERNNLTGSLPPEVALFEGHLTTIDLTTNLIYMEGDMFDVFVPLVNLETLLLDDNFMVCETGLPPQFKNLEKLEKLRMSYNLLAGQLETEDNLVLSHMGRLTHLEIESNFLSGSMPAVISELTDLAYLYMRRNEMSYDLNFLKGGKLLGLYALWLDSNDIIGSIPSEIGLLTALASISITNSTLTGSIPTEMGKLTGLRRLWLYSNLLTGNIPSELQLLGELEVVQLHHNDIEGDVPEGVCETIENSVYKFKALTADCNAEVSCAKDCCTECFD
jgi:hypothetical protein